MKKLKAFLLSLLALCVTCGAAACETLNSSSGESGSQNSEVSESGSSESGSSESDWIGEGAYNVITIAEALKICETATEATTERYYIRGTIDTLTSTQYGTMTVSDETGSIYVYGTYGADGSLRYNALDEKPVVGDEVLLYCSLQNYNGKMEVYSGWIIAFKSNAAAQPELEIVKTPGTGLAEGYDVISIAMAKKIGEYVGDATTTERYYIHATVESITNAAYGAMVITDGTDSISVYGTYSSDGVIGYASMEQKPYKGDEVLLACTLHSFSGTAEVQNARLIDFKSAVIDESSYTEMSVAEARQAKEGDLVKVDGVVAKITYANGMVPNGIYLVDDTQSIYVFDGDLAARVAIGNQITILATKTYWILETEQANAAKHGYNGCNQLADATLVSNDEGNNAFDTSWITESTVKEIVETSVTEDITTTIYKVNALVEKRAGSGFTNYYFFDIDGETGSYTYTQCNGSDFAWLDEFDGKICTVYLSAINAKSTASACYFRLLPISVAYENYTFDTANAAKFAVEYYGAGQFETLYYADPALELTTSVSSELLGFENATIEYASDNTDAIYFETAEGKTVMHCKNNGKANVTITGKYGDNTYSETVAIEFVNPDSFECITVAQAIEATVDSEVTVRGIVGPSLVNKNGFYLFGEDGSMIAVVVNSTDEFKGLEIGHEVILKGMRERYVKDDASAFAGQTCIVDADILVNLYGEHEYSTAKFVTDKTLADFYALDANVDYSTTVYVVKATVNVVSTNYYTNINLTSADGTSVSLYCSGAAQYAWLQEFAGQEVTIEIAACNWNDKTYWRGCVLSVRTEDGKVLNTLNFDTY